MKTKILKYGFKKLTKAKSRIIAHLIGDGCVYKSNHDYNIKYEVKDQESLDSFEEDLISVYGLKLTKGFKNSGFTGKPIPFIRLRSKLAYEDLLRYATYNSRDWKINSIIPPSSKTIKKEFLKALFDDEGSVIIKSKNSEVRLYSINLDGLTQIQKILLDFGINTKITPGYGLKRNVYAVIIKDLMAFRKKIGFNLRRKQDKLDTLKF
ncbi:MAG: LAGLIDADG family homing endonuclease [Nanoarchaeota archaeon]